MSTALPHVDPAGFTRVYERHHQALYRYCRSILRHEQDAQDALQSAMMRAFVALQTERRELELRPWLFRIAHNESINILRRRSHAGVLDETLGDAATLEDCVADRETMRLLRRDLLDLPERQRSALVLRELNGLGHEEIAAVLDTTPAAVKQAIFEGRSALLRCREGRDAACAEIQRVLSDGDGRILRSRPVRAHLRVCAGCREFRGALAHRPRELAALLPPLPGGTALALLRGLFDGPAAAVTAGGLTTGLAAKAAVVVAIAGGGGAVALHARSDAPRHAASPVTGSAPAPARTLRMVSEPAAIPAPVPPPSRRHAAQPVPVADAGPVTGLPRHGKRAPADAGPAGHGTPAATGGVAVPPGEARKLAHEGAIPPGTATKQPGAAATPPGHAESPPAAATPGQARKQPKPTPPGQATKPPKPTPPGHARNAPAAAPPGRAAKPPKPAPPWHANNAPAAAPPGQAKKQPAPAATLPGRVKKHTAPATAPPAEAIAQTAPATTPPGQAKKQPAASSTPPGQAGNGAPSTPGAGSPADASPPDAGRAGHGRG